MNKTWKRRNSCVNSVEEKTSIGYLGPCSVSNAHAQQQQTMKRKEKFGLGTNFQMCID